MKIYAVTGAILEIFLFLFISNKIKINYLKEFNNPITYYWLCFTILTGIWEFFYVFQHTKVVNMSKNLILYKQHVWFKKYNLSMILPSKLSYIFYSEYGAYADREYMLKKDYWSRIIESSHLLLCAYFSFFTLYFFNTNKKNSTLCLGISMGTQLMNSLLYLAQYLIQIKNINNINYNSRNFPVGFLCSKRPFMWINLFWTVMPSYILYNNLYLKYRLHL